MAEGFYSIKVSKVVEETKDAKTFYFDIPSNLADTFGYLPGQYLTFEAEINGEKVRRSYSLCTYSELDPQPAVTVKRVDNGLMSNYMNNQLNPGSEIEIMPPNGKFYITPNADNKKHYVLFAGGSGITPMLGISKAVLSKEPNSKITLIYCNRDADSVIFKNIINELEKNSNGKMQVIYGYDKAPLTWFGLKGFLTNEKVINILQNKIGSSPIDCEYYICGPSPMMDVVKAGIAQCGVNNEKVYTEYFAAKTDSPKATETSTEFTGIANVTVTVYGKTHSITCDKNTTILSAAMKQGIDPPYSCTVGVCTTCRAKVNKGSVHMLEREGLSDSEIAQGYVLTCQSLPTSANIELKYE